MARFLRRAARLLVTAGAIGAVPLALANTPAPTDAPSPTSGVHLVGILHVSQSQAQLEAMKVEMAWLADRITYQFTLEVDIKGEGLEIRGQVSDEAGHQRALEIARQSCYLPVSDAINVAPNVPPHAPTPETINKAAREALTRQLGVKAVAFDVSVRGSGMIVLRGQVGSVEEKLLASRCLRGLPGCTCIINCLGVTPIRHAGHTITLVTSDGRHAVHGIVSITAEIPGEAPQSVPLNPEPAAPQSTAPQTTAPQTTASATTGYTPPASPTLTLPSGLPPTGSTLAPLPPLPPPTSSLPPRMSPTTSSTAPGLSSPLPTATSTSVSLSSGPTAVTSPAPSSSSPPPAAPSTTASPAALPSAVTSTASSLPPRPTPVSTPSLTPAPMSASRTAIQPVSGTQPSAAWTPAAGYNGPSPGYSTPLLSPTSPQSMQTLPSYPTYTACTKGMQLAVVPPNPKEPVSKPSLWERLTSFMHPKPKETAVIVATPKPVQARPADLSNVAQPRMQATAAATTTTAPKTASTTTAWPPAYRGQPSAAVASETPDQFRSTLLVRRPSPPPVAEVSGPTLTSQAPPLAPPPAVSTTSAPSPVIRVSSLSTQTSTPVVAAAASMTPARPQPFSPPAGSTALPGPMGPSVTPASLRAVVQKGCGKLAREVRVEKGNEGQLKVHVVGYRESEQQLIATLLALPEVASTSVRLEIHVSH